MIFAKVLYDNNKAAEALFTGKTEDFKVELKAILDGMRRDTTLRRILLEAMNEQADAIERKLNDE